MTTPETTTATALTCTHCLQTFEDDKQLRIHREYDICSGHDGHEWKTTATGNCYWAGRCDACGQTRQRDSSG